LRGRDWHGVSSRLSRYSAPMWAPFCATERFISSTVSSGTAITRPGRKRRQNKQATMLLLPQILECLPGLLLCRGWISALLQEKRLRLVQEGVHARIEGIEVFAEAQGVKLITALLNGLRHRGADAASLVAQTGSSKPTAAPRSEGVYKGRPPRSPAQSTSKGQTPARPGARPPGPD